jgi:transcriptional regulator with XRE-family HTH domain
MSFRENLKAEITYKDILVKELAVLSGINKRTLDNYLRENGSIPSADAAVAIAEALDVSVEYLVRGHKKTGEKQFSDLDPESRFLLQSFEGLDREDRKITLNLIKSLKEREEHKKTTEKARASAN